MRRILREIGRAPARIITSVFALALAVGAIGVFAIPSVAASSLRSSVDRDQMANLQLSISDSGSNDLADIVGAAPNVDRYEGEVGAAVLTGRDGGATLPIVGIDPGDQRVDIVTPDVGRLPAQSGEVIVADGVASVGDQVSVTALDGRTVTLDVVGVGSTAFWAGEDVAFATLGTARDLSGVDGFNRIAIRAADDSAEALRATADDIRDRLARNEVTFTDMAVPVPDGTHPIEADISQVSTMIGFLGIVAGLVALVLLGSTATTLITQRSQEVAVMRSLGGRSRELRRSLRRRALSIAVAAVIIGVPLGIAISNLIARMVLQRFVGITPAIGVSIPVVVASALFALVGARAVAGGAARRVSKLALVTALRDRDGQPFGRRFTERLVGRSRLGGLLDRAALRNLVHRRGRSMAIFAEITAAVAALLIIASLATTINAFNDAEFEPWEWTSRTSVPGDGLPIDAAAVDPDPTSEMAIDAVGEVDGWETDLDGLAHDTVMIDRTVDAGAWLDGTGGVVVSSGFADHLDIVVGDTIDVEMATGPHRFEVIGLHPLRGRTVFFDVDQLAAALGQPGHGNVVYSTAASPVVDAGPLAVTNARADLVAVDSGRTAILAIFAAIGAIVVSVAGLAVASGLAVNVYERRRELATLRAIGGRSRDVLRVVAAELLPLAAAGIGVGIVAGYVGSLSIMTSFENADAVEIGLVFASGAVPVAALVVVVGCLAIATLTVRRIDRRSLAETLRSAT